MELPYEEFLRRKAVSVALKGFDIAADEINPLLKPHQRDVVIWCVRKGCAALFESFGLGKTFQQLEIIRLILKRTRGRGLIIAPLGVIHEFKRDAEKLGIEIRFVRRLEQCGESGIYITNYETVRDGKLDPRLFIAVSLDEAAILRSFGGTKTFREFMKLFEHGQVKYKFVATACPSPNQFIELLSYAAFLDVMDVGQAKTRFFERDSTKADNLTLRPHKEREFFLWLPEWAVFLQRPSDLGYSDEGYILPELEIHWHELPTSHEEAGHESSGQGRIYKDTAIGVTHAAREKKASMLARIAKLMELRQIDPEAHRLIWHDLEPERAALEAAIPHLATVYGNQELDEREKILYAFADGAIQELGGKPQMLACGNNFQRHCWWEIFLGIGFKFHDFIQAIHRCHRFLQTHTVRLDLIYTEAERHVRYTLERKWKQHEQLMRRMSEIIREYGLAANIHKDLQRHTGVKRTEVTGNRFILVNNDSVYETRKMESNSVHLILSSIPFATQYEYSPSYLDFGHTDSNEHFWWQMDYLIPNLLQILKPGRVAAIHVKDRIVPGGITGLGFQTIYPFHADAIYHFSKHGFRFLGMKTIVTDVVRENNQTYRLGWSEQCKDGSRMGAGLPEYLLLFRKPQTDTSKGYADDPVVKEKALYSRHRWQVDAHGFMRVNGDRLLCKENIVGLPHHAIFKLFRERFRREIYNYEEHVNMGEVLEVCSHCQHIHLGVLDDDEGKICGQITESGMCDCPVYKSSLPKKFMLLQPPSWHPDVWTDITRMRTLNGSQYAQGREMHLCPMQFDIAKRVINQFSMPGELVLDPFNGIGTVTSEAVKMGRRAYGIELAPGYHADAVYYTQAAENRLGSPTLFNLLEIEEGETEECLSTK